MPTILQGHLEVASPIWSGAASTGPYSTGCKVSPMAAPVLPLQVARGPFWSPGQGTHMINSGDGRDQFMEMPCVKYLSAPSHTPGTASRQTCPGSQILNTFPLLWNPPDDKVGAIFHPPTTLLSTLNPVVGFVLAMHRLLLGSPPNLWSNVVSAQETCKYSLVLKY